MLLEDICDIYSGYAIKEFNEDKLGIPVIKISNILKDGTIELDDCQYTIEKIDHKYQSKYDDIYIALSGATTGKIGILKSYDKFIINQRVGIVRKKENTIPIEFIKYFLFYYTDRILKEASGCAQPNISPKQIGKYILPRVGINNIKFIVEILESLTNIIKKRKEQLNRLDELIKARFVELFGNPITNTKRFETKDLKDVLLLKAGEFTAASDIFEKPTVKNKYPCYGGNGIRGYVAEYNQEGDYSLIGRQGALSGNVQYATGQFKNTEHALLVTPIIEMNSIWLNQLLINLYLKRFQTGAAQPGLSVKNLKDMQIIIVPIDVQDKYAEFVKKVNKSKFLTLHNHKSIYTKPQLCCKMVIVNDFLNTKRF